LFLNLSALVAGKGKKVFGLNIFSCVYAFRCLYNVRTAQGTMQTFVSRTRAVAGSRAKTALLLLPCWEINKVSHYNPAAATSCRTQNRPIFLV